MIRPLARWTFGKPLPASEEILKHSVRRFQSIYPEFDVVICYNNLTIDQLRRLESLNIPLHKQTADQSVCSLMDANLYHTIEEGASGWGWKLVPPRLRFDSYELWLDNDIVIRERLPSIDHWLSQETTLISADRRPVYGIFNDKIQGSYCAGFFGVPPKFDFAESIRQHYHGEPLGGYDEQGLTVMCVLDKDPIVVPMDELAFVKTLRRPFAKGLHFIGINRTIDYHQWRDYVYYMLMP